MSANSHRDRLDRITSKRLARLAGRPIDTTRLEQRLERALASEAVQQPIALSLRWKPWWRPIPTAAAAVLIVLIAGWFALSGGSSPAIAAPADFAQIHFDVSKGLSPHLTVSSVAEANQLLADPSNGIVTIPDLPGAIKSCCLHHYAGATLICALIEQDGKLITVAVANGAELHSPAGKVVTRGGRELIVHASDGINMVMTQQGNSWLCVMGESDTDQLLNIAEAIKF